MARDEDLDLLKSLRLCAYGAVKAKDSDYVLRFIFRWYSREFKTSLAEVEAMPLEEVLTHFFECRYENMDDDALEEEEKLLCETASERLARETLAAVDAEADDDFFKEAVANIKQGPAGPAGKRKRLDEAAIDPDLGRSVLLPVMGEKLPQSFQDVINDLDPKLKEVPADVKMQFVSDDELSGLDDWDVMGPSRPRGDG